MTAVRVQMLPNCEGEEPDLLPVTEAYRRIDGSLVAPEEAESVALTDALGRVLAESVVSPFDVPPHRNSAMDGYALSGNELPRDAIRSLTVIGTAWAGHPFARAPGSGECVRIMTGAPMPTDTDTVIMQEQVEVDGDQIRIDGGHQRGQNVRDAGEDIQAGACVVPAGRRIGPAELGLIASLGQANVQCFPRLRVAIFSTGDEVRSIGEELVSGTIYDSNRFTLIGMLQRLDVDIQDMGVLADDREVIQAALDKAGKQVDVILTSGGVSAGAADFVKTTLEDLGQVGFWKIAIRPGRPLAFGRIHNAAFFGLPGNPVAVMVTFYQFVRAALRTLAGETVGVPEPLLEATLASKLRKKTGRVEYYRAIVERDDTGALQVRATGATGSGLLHTMSQANCFVILPEDCASLEPGATVQIQPFYGLV